MVAWVTSFLFYSKIQNCYNMYPRVELSVFCWTSDCSPQGAQFPWKEFFSMDSVTHQQCLLPSQMCTDTRQEAVDALSAWASAQWGGLGWQELTVICSLLSLCSLCSHLMKGKGFPFQPDIKRFWPGVPWARIRLAGGINQTHFTPLCLSGVVVSLTQPHSLDLIKTQFPLLFNLWGLACRIKRLQTKSPICETLLNSSCYDAYLYSIKLIRNESADPLWIKRWGVCLVHAFCSLLGEHLCKMIIFIFIPLEFSKSGTHKLL